MVHLGPGDRSSGGLYGRLGILSGDQLEHGIAVLFHLLGFSVVHFGKNAFNTDSPDVLAFNPAGDWLCVIEATAGGSARELDLPAKIEKLAARGKEIAESTPDLRVLPVLVIPRAPSLLTEGSRDRARAERISLVTSDKLQQLVALSMSNPSPTLVVDFLLSAVPGSF